AEALSVYRSASAGVLSAPEVLWGCALATYLSGSTESARDLIGEAYQLVQRDGAAIGPGPMRASWLESAPVRDIVAAYERDEWRVANQRTS
ncbi:MAG: hypothetical protein M3N19_02810, partial [Candidatus Eremiobacteraeota bacterium]|nr:hypothetical protein [Candidatus Eremiobacteraeota bacterium]